MALILIYVANGERLRVKRRKEWGFELVGQNGNFGSVLSYTVILRMLFSQKKLKQIQM